MAMRTATPWWLSLVLGIGLALVFLGERLFAHTGGMRGIMTMLGVVLVIGATGVRAWGMVGSTGARRRVERTLLLCHIGTLLGLFLYALTTNFATQKLAFSESGTQHWLGALTVLYAVVLFASIVPVLMIELSLGQALRTNFEIGQTSDVQDAFVEYPRVRDVGWSGITVALAAAFLMVTCQVASQRNVQRDVSYFKTAAPGESSRKIVEASADPIKVLLFFPETNAVKEQVKDYFESLASSSGGKLTIETHDRFVNAELAGKYKVTKDGVIVLVKGTGDKEKSQTLDVDVEIEKARKGSGKLRNFDKEVNSVLMKIARDKRKAYVMTGHGEINDQESVPVDLKGRVPERRTTVFKKRLGELNYEVKDLGLMDLAKDVPDDATLVIMLAPTLALQPAEWEALDRYLVKGGRVMIALDPKAEASMGVLEGRLGLKFLNADLTDDQAFLPQRGTPADRRFAITQQFSAHASTTSLSRSVDKGLVLIDSGALEDVPFSNPAAAPTKTVTIRSQESAFLDYNNNFNFDATMEKRQRWNLAAAVEGPKLKDKDGKDKDGFRALVFADVDLFADALVSSGMGRAAVVLVSGPLLDDSVRWLGGEEQFVGESVSEDDKPLKHTKDQDAKWFTLTVVAGPLLVLVFGLVGTWARRRRPATKPTEVKP
ncbi:MAG: Gldg family protein [Deltaproteobacteria bacterium]|nr:Gldg family protein [Deltaproteobacteria bacterium]